MSNKANTQIGRYMYYIHASPKSVRGNDLPDVAALLDSRNDTADDEDADTVPFAVPTEPSVGTQGFTH